MTADIVLLDVFLAGTPIGSLTRLPGDRVLFVFDDAYRDDAARDTLSLSFRDIYGGLITDHRPTQTRLPPFFANLLPEGGMRTYLAERAGVHPQREFFLLEILGHDLPGAVEVRPADAPNAAAILPDDPPARPPAESPETALRFSLAGVQLKFSAVQESHGGLTIPVDGAGGSWIVKLPSTVYGDVPENEFAMMALARAVGIDVPETALLPLDAVRGLPPGMDRVGGVAYAIKRFDRSPDGMHIHMEDFAQVFGVYPDKKYEKASYRNIAQVLWAETGEEGIGEFIRRLTFNALIGNGDMHLKNWSLLYPDGRQARIAPAYDYVSTVPYIAGEKLALGFANTKAFAELDRDRFMRFAAKARLPEKLVLDRMTETLDLFAEAWRPGGAAADLAPPAVRAAIDRHLESLPLWTGR